MLVGLAIKVWLGLTGFHRVLVKLPWILFGFLFDLLDSKGFHRSYEVITESDWTLIRSALCYLGEKGDPWKAKVLSVDEYVLYDHVRFAAVLCERIWTDEQDETSQAKSLGRAIRVRIHWLTILSKLTHVYNSSSMFLTPPPSLSKR